MPPTALVLQAHGARDPRWAEPFGRIRERVRADAPARRPMLSYLELMAPDLAVTVHQVREGFSRIRILPLFLRPGGHLRSDIPRLLDDAKTARPCLDIEIVAPAGEDERVIEAIASYCVG